MLFRLTVFWFRIVFEYLMSFFELRCVGQIDIPFCSIFQLIIVDDKGQTLLVGVSGRRNNILTLFHFNSK